MNQDQDGLLRGEDGLLRCWWQRGLPDYQDYHDREWGFAVTDDRRLFEKICLEGFQAGLSWLTILRKREAFRRAFHGFDFERVARYNRRSVERLMGDPGIVRHRQKIQAAIHNARRALALCEEFGSLANYFWQHVPSAEERPPRLDYASVRHLAVSPTSRRLAADLKTRGWRFVGPTTAYAFMQAMGLVNDHLEGCAKRGLVETQRRQQLLALGTGSGATEPR